MKKTAEEKPQDILQIPCTLFKISTLPLGGHRICFDVPETSPEGVRELIGKENKHNFVMCLVKLDEKTQENKPEKCQPLKKHLTYKK